MPQGQLAKAYVVDGTTYTEIDLAKEVSIEDSNAEVDAATRANGNAESTEVGRVDWTLTLTTNAPENDTPNIAYAALRAAKNARTTIRVLALTGDRTETGAEGPLADWVIPNAPRQETANEKITYAFTLRLNGDSTWFTVA